jgi:hypothetical protein
VHDGERETALAAFRESLSRRRTVWALRNAAVMEKELGNRDAAVGLLREAAGLRPGLPTPSLEYGAALLEAGRPGEWLDLAARLPGAIRSTGRVRLLDARARLALGSWEALDRFFSDPPEIPDMREGEVSFTDLWFAMHERKTGLDPGGPAADEVRRRIRRDHPPPAAVDFRMGGE